MRCPFCGHPEDRVIDSRAGTAGDVIRRRRECESCEKRFTTYERIEDVLPTVVKKDGRRELFDRHKLLRGLNTACIKRPISVDTIESMADRIEQALRESDGREVTSTQLGELVLRTLAEIDQVAYVRFASVYRSFNDVDAFLEELGKLVGSRER